MRQTTAVAPVALALVLLPVLACARSDESWLREIADPHAGPFRRGLAAIAIAEQAPEHGRSVVNPMLVLLDGPEDLLRPHARDALRQVAPYAVDELLQPLLGPGYLSEDCREALGDALVAAGRVAVPDLLAAMVDPSRSDGRRFGLILGEIGAPAVDPLRRLALDPPSDSVRMDAIWALGRCGPSAKSALPTIVELLRAPDPGPACAAAEAISRIDPESERTLRLLRETLAERRPGAIVIPGRGLARVQCVRARTASPDERAEAMREVLGLGTPVAYDLAEMVEDPDPASSAFATAALAGIASTWTVLPTRRGRGPSLVPVSLKELGSPSADVRRNAAVDLARKGARARSGIAALLRATSDESLGVRTAAVLALGTIAVDLGWSCRTRPPSATMKARR